MGRSNTRRNSASERGVGWREMDPPPSLLGLLRAGVNIYVSGVDLLQEHNVNRRRLFLQTTKGPDPTRSVVCEDPNVVVRVGNLVRITALSSFSLISESIIILRV